MTPKNWKQLKSIFHTALDIEPKERTAFIARACDGDYELRGRVEKLFLSNDDVGDFLAAPALVDAGFMDTLPDIQTQLSPTRVGQRIGPYEVIREIGRGGMGTVFLAVRADDQYHKQVAIKLINRGMDTDTILRRFVMERQILANLEHPNIAGLLEGGTTVDGLPYFVMEYVEGEPIDEYCDARGFTIAQRLSLFRQVCAALHYAHQNLVVHRDIKPSNILVTDEGVPKLLDFGIAKLLSPDWSLTGDATLSMQRLMTPAYASPEQLRGLPITTAADVYSLGVVLYELLSGDHPYQSSSRVPAEMAQVILSEEPERPSTNVNRRLAKNERNGNKNDKARTTDNGQLTRKVNPKSGLRNPKFLRGDLDNIVLKALRKEPERRYASVQEFSEDIRRHLEGLPVSATPDTLGYRAAKFTQRHKAGVLAAAIVLITLLTATFITSWQARVARRERDNAQRRFNDVRRLTNSFLFDFQHSVEDLPGSTSAQELVVKKALEYLENLASEDTKDPSLRFELAAAYQKVGDIQGRAGVANLGDTSGALSSYQKAAGILTSLTKADPANVSYKKKLARVYREIGSNYEITGNLEMALNNHRHAFLLLEELTALAPEDADTRISFAESYKGLGDIVSYEGNLEEALQNYRKAAELSESVLASDPKNHYARAVLLFADEAIGTTLGNPNFTNLGDTSGALEIYRQQLRLTSERLRDDPTSAYYQNVHAHTLKNIGEVLASLGEWKPALEKYEQALAIQGEFVRTDAHNSEARSRLAYMLTNVGEALSETKQINLALPQHKKAIDILRQLCEEDKENSLFSAYLARAYRRNGETLVKAGKLDEALEFYGKAVASDEGMANQNATNMDIRLALANDYAAIAKANVILAGNKALPLVQRKVLWRAARARFELCRDVYVYMQTHNLRTKPINEAHSKTLQEIAACDAGLAASEKAEQRDPQ